MPGLDMQNYATYPYYARSIASIMPGRTWRDNGHKALMPVITCQTCSITPSPSRCCDPAKLIRMGTQPCGLHLRTMAPRLSRAALATRRPDTSRTRSSAAALRSLRGGAGRRDIALVGPARYVQERRGPSPTIPSRHDSVPLWLRRPRSLRRRRSLRGSRSSHLLALASPRACLID